MKENLINVQLFGPENSSMSNHSDIGLYDLYYDCSQNYNSDIQN